LSEEAIEEDLSAIMSTSNDLLKKKTVFEIMIENQKVIEIVEFKFV
jgi:hypothetical protein